jgi:uncharacterized protein YjiS (DUF1127 family)
VLSSGGSLRFCMHAAEGTVVADTKAGLADADFLLDEIALPERAEEAFIKIQAVEGTETPSDEAVAAADRAFARFGDALAAIMARIPQSADQTMLQNAGSVLAHAFENRSQFTLGVVLDKVSETRAEIETHRIRQRALVDAAVSRDQLGEIASQLKDLGLTRVETSEIRPLPDRFLGYVVTGELPR